MVNLQISELYKDKISPDLLELAARETLVHTAASEGVELTIVLESSDYIQALNKQFRQIDAPTDVLSFPVDEKMKDPESGLIYLGDIAISVPKAQSQAAYACHSLDAELQLLTVHGVLHLVGYDHADEEQKKTMWQLQSDILNDIGAEVKSLPEY